jgi:hypothetical protein
VGWLTAGFGPAPLGKNAVVTTSSEPRYTPWWAFAALIAVCLSALGLFVAAASRAPVVQGAPTSQAPTPQQPVTDGKLAFRVVGVERSVPAVGDPFYGATASGGYTVVTLRVRNTSTATVTFDSAYAVGQDAQGRRVVSDREASAIANSATAAMRIPPGGRLTTRVVFDVDRRTRLRSLQVHDSVFSRGAVLPLSGSGTVG